MSRDESLSVERPPWRIDITLPPPLAHRHRLAMVAVEGSLQATDACWTNVRIQYFELADKQRCKW